ncbi:uncharacterized protein [Paramisgurnus dabryanus]|uniref:uncharacterized protein n=1 Tax=Paramisgurnus dabryanus TaxID=90735 RepID=UPI0031F359B0
MFKRVSALEKDHCELYPPHGEDKQSWMMGAVNVVLLVLLVWTFTAVCEDDDDIIISCEVVTAPVGDEINLACNVSYLKQNCYTTMYKFTDTAAAGDICKEQFSKDLLKQERRFSCPYTADKAMTTRFQFYLQSTCGGEYTYFSVNTTDIKINCEDVTAPVGDKINLTCTVSYLNQICYTTMYRFTDTAAAGDICKEQFSKDLSKQESRVSCPYTAKKPMTTKFKFYLQTTCGAKTTYFSVNTSDFIINCEDVTASVGDEITLNCTVSYLNKKCCVKMYKFINTEAADDPTICREELSSDSCKQESRFSCPYKAMRAKLKFFLQTNCGLYTKLFTVNEAGAVKVFTDEPPVQTTDNTTIAVVICLLSCFVIVIVALFLWKRRKTSRHPPDYNMVARENNINEHSDREAL